MPYKFNPFTGKLDYHISAGAGTSPLTTKGDLYTYTSTEARLPVGTDGYVLSADSTESTGLKWVINTGSDEKVGVDAGATPGYLGATSNDGVLRVGALLTYTDGGDFVTLNVDEASVDHDNLANTHNLTTDINHDTILNNHNLTTDIDHNNLTNYEVNEHIDWTVSQAPTVIHADNYTNTTYSAGDFNHDDLANIPANDHIDHTTITLSAGDGLAGGGDISANRTFSVNVDDATIEINTDTLRVKADGINDTHIDWGVGANQVSAVDVPINDAGTMITATEVEGALQENRTAIDLNTTHSSGDGSDHADVATNTAHSTGDGSDHSDVALNTTHRTSDGTDHTYIDQDVTSGSSPTFDGNNFTGIDANDVDIADVGNIITATDVEGALQENRAAIDLNTTHRTSNGTDHTYIDQDIRTTASPTFNDLTISTPSNIYDLSHDNFADFSSNEHIDHTTITFTAGTGLTGGGTIAANRTFNVDVGIADNKIVQIDSSTVADDEYARFTANGLESRSVAEVADDIEASIDHGNLAGLSDDDHTQYLLAAGTRDLTADWTITHSIIIDSDTEGITLGDDQDCDITWDNTEGAADISTGVIIGGTGTSEFNDEVKFNDHVYGPKSYIIASDNVMTELNAGYLFFGYAVDGTSTIGLNFPRKMTLTGVSVALNWSAQTIAGSITFNIKKNDTTQASVTVTVSGTGIKTGSDTFSMDTYTWDDTTDFLQVEAVFNGSTDGTATDVLVNCEFTPTD